MPDQGSSAQAGRFLTIGLNPGIFGRNMVTFYLACYAAIMLATFIPQTQPFLLEEVLGLEQSRQGVVSGNLNFWGEIVIIVTVGLWGSLSDRIGRRAVTAMGFVLVAAGIFMYGFARDIPGLLLGRVIYSAGIAAVSTMIITLMADYVSNPSRGKATGFLGIMNGLGAMTAALFLLKLPAMFKSGGMDAEAAALATYSVMAAVTLAIGVAMYLGLSRGARQTHEDRQPMLRQLREGIAEARRPVIALAYTSSFVARGNLAENGFDAAQACFMDADVNAALRGFLDAGERFDAIVLDPPKLAPTAAHAERAARAYKDINRLALKLLAPGGELFTFSCSGGVSADLFHKIVASAGTDAQVDAYITERLGAAPDHPMTLAFPEGEYLKGLVVLRKPDLPASEDL